MKSISETSLKRTEQLETLYLQHNSLRHLPLPLKHLENLHELWGYHLPTLTSVKTEFNFIIPVILLWAWENWSVTEELLKTFDVL